MTGSRASQGRRRFTVSEATWPETGLVSFQAHDSQMEYRPRYHEDSRVSRSGRVLTRSEERVKGCGAVLLHAVTAVTAVTRGASPKTQAASR